MKRRTLIISLPTIALAGCLRTLGLTEGVVVGEKTLAAVEYADGEERTRTLAVQRNGDDGPTYDDVDESLADDLHDGEPFVVTDELQLELAETFTDIRYGIRACDDAAPTDPDELEACRALSVVREDFNELNVGDVAEMRISDDGAGLMDVLERRDDSS